MTETSIRPSPLAGLWYSADPAVLISEVEGYLASAVPPEIEGEIVAIMAPHAGHRYSGPVAGYAFQPLQRKSYETVAVLSPYHRSHSNPLLTSGHSAYHTPLGDVPVDTDSIRRLGEHLVDDGLSLTPIYQDQEHAVEIELPFLQVALMAGFNLLPVMLSGLNGEMAVMLGKALAKTLEGKNALLVASTDLSHFYQEAEANTLDRAMLDAVATFDIPTVIETHRSGKGQACGVMAVIAVMTAAMELGATQVQILGYATSGATSGDYSRVVGYGAGVFVK